MSKIKGDVTGLCIKQGINLQNYSIGLYYNFQSAENSYFLQKRFNADVMSVKKIHLQSMIQIVGKIFAYGKEIRKISVVKTIALQGIPSVPLAVQFPSCSQFCLLNDNKSQKIQYQEMIIITMILIMLKIHHPSVNYKSTKY